MISEDCCQHGGCHPRRLARGSRGGRRGSRGGGGDIRGRRSGSGRLLGRLLVSLGGYSFGARSGGRRRGGSGGRSGSRGRRTTTAATTTVDGGTWCGEERLVAAVDIESLEVWVRVVSIDDVHACGIGGTATLDTVMVNEEMMAPRQRDSLGLEAVRIDLGRSLGVHGDDLVSNEVRAEGINPCRSRPRSERHTQKRYPQE